MRDTEEEPLVKEELRRRYQQMSEPQDKELRDWQSLVEEQIARLDLSNLPGKGKPLDLSINPYVTPEEEAAQRLIKNAGYTLPWIEEGREIDAAVNAARRKLEQAWEEYRALRDAELCSGHQWVEGAWLAACREFRQEAGRINRQIRDYNLKAPVASLHKFAVRVEEELARLGASA